MKPYNPMLSVFMLLREEMGTVKLFACFRHSIREPLRNSEQDIEGRIIFSFSVLCSCLATIEN